MWNLVTPSHINMRSQCINGVLQCLQKSLLENCTYIEHLCVTCNSVKIFIVAYESLCSAAHSTLPKEKKGAIVCYSTALWTAVIGYTTFGFSLTLVCTKIRAA